jgi:hypothetical protein
MPRKAFPVHVDTMPSVQMNGLVITMPDFTARMDDRIADISFGELASAVKIAEKRLD